MNRTLKFRAWDKLEKRFFYPDKGHQGHYVLYLNGQFQNLQNGSGGDEYLFSNGLANMTRIENQFTKVILLVHIQQNLLTKALKLK